MFLGVCLTLLICLESIAQTAPGGEITTGNFIYSEGGGAVVLAEEPPENRGALKLKLSLNAEGESALLLDQYDIQSTSEGNFGGTIFMQDQGGCLVLTDAGTTEIDYLIANDIEFGNAIQTKASGEIAYGATNKFGNKETGSSNWSVNYNGVEEYYEITINGEDYSSLDYSTIVTPHSLGLPVIATTSSVSNKLIVRLFNMNGDLINGSFAFSVNKYQEAPDMEDACEGESGPVITSKRRGRNLK